MIKKIKSVCVFCGARAGNKDEYSEAAKAVGNLLVQHNLTLVYGGANVGLMKVVADEVLALDGQVIGVIPESLVNKELAHPRLTTLHIVPSMHERKLKMIELSDCFVMLPGGAGSLDEFFEVFTLGQLDFHQKPYAILNTNHYYDSLIAFMDKAVSDGFLSLHNREKVIIETSPQRLFSQFMDE